MSKIKIKKIVGILVIFILVFSAQIKANYDTDSLLVNYYSATDYNNKLILGEKLLDEIRYSNPELTIHIADSLAIICEAKQDKKASLFYNFLGDANWHLGNLDQSNFYFQKAKSNYEKNNNLEGIATSQNNIAYNYFEMGNYTLALKHLSEAYRIAKKINNDDLLSVTNTYLAQVNVKIRNYHQAFVAYQQAIEIFKKNKKGKNLATVYNNIGNIYLEQNKYDNASEWFKKSYNLSVDSNYIKEIAIAAGNLGLNYLDQKKYSEASKYLNEAYLKFEFLNSQIFLIDVSTNLIRMYVELNDLKKATEIANKSEPHAKEIDSYRQLVNYAKSLSELYFATKNYEKAYYYSQQQLVYVDSLASENKQQLQNEMAAKFQNQKLEDKVELLTKNNILKDTEIEKKQIQRKYLLVLISSVILITILLSFIIANKNKSQKKLAKQNILIKNALSEREVLLREIHHRVKNNLQIVSSLLNLQHNYAQTKTPTEILRACESQIQSMALMHEKLYKNDNLKNIDLKDYFINFIENIKQSYVSNMQYDLDVDSIEMDIDQLVPFGLILHELIVNSIKHGYTDTDIALQLITIKASVIDTKLSIIVFDNGKGLPPDFSFNKYNSLGVRLINGLVNQLKGTVEYDLNHKGAYYKIMFNFTTK